MIAVASCASAIGADEDQPVLEKALRAAGCEVRLWAWDDPAAAWAEADLVIIRSTWDYVDRHSSFCAWTDQVAAMTPIHNPPEIIRWNSDKRYLAELGSAGVAVTPTIWLDPGDSIRWPDSDEIVVKPTISNGSQDTTRHDISSADGAARAHASLEALLAAGRGAMVQPYLTAVDHRGETGLVYVDGEFLHAFRKAPLLNKGAPATDDLYAREQITAATATSVELALAEQTLEVVPGSPSLLYARVDVAPGPDGRPLLMELELIEPSLFFAVSNRSATALATAVAERIRLS